MNRVLQWVKGHDPFANEKDKAYLEADDFFKRMKDYRPSLWTRITRLVNSVWSFFRYDIPQGLYGLWYWKKFAWKWREWDFLFLLDAIKLHLEKLGPTLENGWAEGGAKSHREIKIALNLLERIQVGTTYKGMEFEKRNKLENRDWNMLFNLMRRKGRTWWD